MDLSSSTRGHLPPTGPELRQERNNRVEWSKSSTEEMREFLRPMRSDMLASMYAMMGPEERHEFSERMARFANEEAQEHTKIDAIREMAKSLAGLEDFLHRVPDAAVTSNAPQPSREAYVRQNVATDVTLRDVILETPPNRQIVTVLTSDVAAPTVTPSSVVVRAKRGADGLYHCRECGYTTGRAGTLRMHRFRKHKKNRI